MSVSHVSQQHCRLLHDENVEHKRPRRRRGCPLHMRVGLNVIASCPSFVKVNQSNSKCKCDRKPSLLANTLDGCLDSCKQP